MGDGCHAVQTLGQKVRHAQRQEYLTELPLEARLPAWGVRGDCSPVARARVRPTGARLGPYEVVMMPPRASGDGAFLQAKPLSEGALKRTMTLPNI